MPADCFRWFSTATATLEVVRRFSWTLLRVEAEHSTNVSKLRAFDDAPLPSLERARLAAAAGAFYQNGGAGGKRSMYRPELMAATTVHHGARSIL